MISCTICHFDSELDDIVFTTIPGHGVCLRCFDRETGGARRMPKALRRELTATLAAYEPA